MEIAADMEIIAAILPIAPQVILPRGRVEMLHKVVMAIVQVVVATVTVLVVVMEITDPRLHLQDHNLSIPICQLK
jgi:hypothetical protein